MLLPITLTFAAAAALLNIWLAWRVGKARGMAKVLHGDGGDPLLIRRMRAQANFVEYTPFVLILFALVELAMGPSTWLWLLALAYILGRVAHAFGMDSGTLHNGRKFGILTTFIVTVLLAGVGLYSAYGQMHGRQIPSTIGAHG